MQDMKDYYLTAAQRQRVWTKVRFGDGCWLWLGSLNANGYGQMAIGSKRNQTRSMGLAHRISYTLLRGRIPDNLTLDHL